MRNWWKWLLGAIIVIVILAAIAFIVLNSGLLGNRTGITLRSPFLRPFMNGRGIMPFATRPGTRLLFGAIGLLIPCVFGLLLIGLVILVVSALRPKPYYPPQAQPASSQAVPASPPAAPGAAPAQPAQPFQAVQPTPLEPVKTCPNCGRIVQADWSHCPYCGAPLK